jgi:hypothetical protein
MKLLHLIFILAAIQASYFLLYNHNVEGDIKDMFQLGNYTNITANASLYTSIENYSSNFTTAGLAGYTSQTFWESALDFKSGGSQTGMLVLLGIFAATFWGLALFYRSELTLLAPIFIFIVGIGILPCMSLYLMITSDIGQYACIVSSGGTATNCLLSSIIGFFSAGMLFIMWVLSCLEWWTARSTA